MRFYALIAALLVSSPAFAVDSYEMQADKSNLNFIATQDKTPIEGQFSKFTSDIKFNENELDKSSIKVVVDIASVTSKNADAQAMLPLPEWLSAKLFPQAVFQSKTIARMPLTNDFYMDGELSIRDVKKPVTVNFTLQHPDKSRVIATGFATLSRKDFGVGQGKWGDDGVVKDTVRVEFRIVADKK